MSELSPPTPADSGRQSARHAARDKAAKAYSLRRRLLRAVMVPAVSELVLLTFAVVFASAARLSALDAAWLTAGTTAAGGGMLVMAYRHMLSIARTVEDEDRHFGEWLVFLRKRLKTGSVALQEYAEAVRRGDRSARPPAHAPVEGSHTFADLDRSISAFEQVAAASVAQGMQHQHLAVFVNVARRLQSYCESAFRQLDPVLRNEEDPHRLTDLYGVDHQITQMARSADNMLVLGGDRSARISQPVSIKAVLRHGIQEIQHFTRVQITEAPTALLQGFAVKDTTHLLAELLENATRFSDQDVYVRAEYVPDGLLIEVDDRGLPIELAQRRRLNALLREPDQFDVAEHLIQDGRSGLFVVARLAQRHRIRVELLRNRYGSTQAAVIIPHALLAAEHASLPAQGHLPSGPQAAAVSAGAAPIPGHVLLTQAAQRSGAEPPPARGAVPDRRHLTVAGSEPATAPVAAAVSATSSGAASSTAIPADAVAPTPGRQALPRRTGTHVAPELLQATGAPASPTEANPQLAAGFARGFQAPGTDEPGEGTAASPASFPHPDPTHEEMS